MEEQWRECVVFENVNVVVKAHGNRTIYIYRVKIHSHSQTFAYFRPNFELLINFNEHFINNQKCLRLCIPFNVHKIYKYRSLCPFFIQSVLAIDLKLGGVLFPFFSSLCSPLFKGLHGFFEDTERRKRRSEYILQHL